jgi:hypothetical protein
MALASASVMAQGKTNFAGKWTLDPASAPAPPAGGGGRGGGRGGFGGWGGEFTATQDATTLTIEYMTGGQNPAPQKLIYKLDGSDSKNMVGIGRGGPSEAISKATWDGAKLVITTTQTMNMGGNEMKIESKRVLSLDGGTLTIETTASGMRGGEPTTTKVVYKKS